MKLAKAIRNTLGGAALVLALMSSVLFFAHRATAQTPAVHTQATLNYDYPRLHIYQAHALDEAELPAIARNDVIVLDDRIVRMRPQSLAQLRALNPNAKILAFIPTEEVLPQEADTRFLQTPYDGWWLLRPYTKLDQDIGATDTQFYVANGSKLKAGDDVRVGLEHMHVTSVSGNRIRVQRGYYSVAASHSKGTHIAAHASSFYDYELGRTWMLNNSIYTPRDGQGRRWTDFLAQYVRDTIIASGLWDGVLLDQCADHLEWIEGGNTDANNDGVADATVGWQDGVRQLITQIRAYAGPDFLLVGNTSCTPYDQMNGLMLESFSAQKDPYGQTASSPYIAELDRWQFEMNRYATWAQLGQPPFTALINSNTYNTDQVSYRDMRFGLASTLMGDGFFYYDSGDQRHGDTWWFDEYDNAGQGRGYLGQPLADARWLDELPGTLLSNGSFEDGQTDWDTYVDHGSGDDASFSPDTTSCSGGNASMHVAIRQAPGADDYGNWWRVRLLHGDVSVSKDQTYTVSFWARASSHRQIAIWVQMMNNPYSLLGLWTMRDLGTSWRHYTISFRANQTFGHGGAGIGFGLASATGDVWVDDVRFQSGAARLWRRDFAHGVALVNASPHARVVDLGGTFRKINGVQDRTVNDGSEVNSVTLPPYDGIILLRPPAVSYPYKKYLPIMLSKRAVSEQCTP